MDFVKMLQKQDELNKAIAGENWLDGITDEGKIIDWSLALSMECAEAINSFPWKHWKDIDDSEDMDEILKNIDNIKIELVEIWHFLLSLAMNVEYVNTEATGDELYRGIGEYLETVIQGLDFPEDNSLSMRDDVSLLHIVMGQASIIKYGTDLNEYSVLADMFASVAILAQQILGDTQKLEDLYYGKHILNDFRQKHGYKDGSYKKLWKTDDGKKKDKIVMMNLVLEGTPLDELYEALEEKYKNA